MSFCLKTPKWESLDFQNWDSLNFWRPITFRANIWLRWGVKWSCSPCQEISNGMWHVTYTYENQGDSWLLMAITCVLSIQMGHASPFWTFKFQDFFQWYKELFIPMGFDPCNRCLKIWESIGTSTPKVEIHLGVWRFIPSHFPTLLRTWNVTPRLHSWLALSQALTLVTSSKLGLRQYLQHRAIDGTPR